jgi:REP element-mobilizing transposase RayT
MRSERAFAAMDLVLDSYMESPRYLQITDVARLVADVIQQGAGSWYALHTWVIMPNHVHLLITPQADFPKLMQHLKASTARQANQFLGRTGLPFWQEESFQRVVRDAEELRKIQEYIAQNPVRAGLAASPEKYVWSSAFALSAGCKFGHASPVDQPG